MHVKIFIDCIIVVFQKFLEPFRFSRLGIFNLVSFLIFVFF